MPEVLLDKNKKDLQTTLDPDTSPNAELEQQVIAPRRGRMFQQVQAELSRYLKLQHLSPVRDIVLVGDGPAVEDIYMTCLSDENRTLRFRGCFNDGAVDGILSDEVIGTVEEVKTYAKENNIDEILCALPGTEKQKIFDLMRFAENNTIRFRLIPSSESYIPSIEVSQLEFIGGVPSGKVRKEPLEKPFNRVIKRAFDIVFSFSMILFVFTWLFPILAVLVKLSSPGPVFFKQLRGGRDNDDFVCWKFRSMRMSPVDDTRQATKNDPRVTRIGAILRKTNLDEMPQFLNVLMGQMSVVGPRPHPNKLNDKYRDIVDKYMVRHFVTPGVTGWAQVNGFRGETAVPELMEKRVEFDVWYLENWSFWLDLRIVCMTFTKIFKTDPNAY